MSHTQNPDMIAFTIGRASLSLVQNGAALTLDGIMGMLSEVIKCGPKDGVTPEMARSALAAVGQMECLT